ncbi:DUF2785 domain-containing protein [Bacillus sp. 31A1R]|uniref:DUF2785 domain-containing protein n=1 Tax=Robertmurraya mangrovi TaxID=3098077 RepID=A0ABU5IYP7_9BACI|nr:DUF2785 domain-containing protein [Bacillus sp. 31A1R]MDZ5472256.1 DUF2785 domain-containing protein [Bacillus sp. 31A1R]
MELKNKLKEVIHLSKVEIDDQVINDTIEDMLVHIGELDPELRDQLIYSTFAKWISEDFLTNHQLQYILETCLDQKHLFYNIGKLNDDAVFTRSFSSLVIASVLEKDRELRFLHDDMLLQVFNDSITYLHAEEDVRGYVEGKGWAHSIAHGADLLAACVLHPLFTNDLYESILASVSSCLFKEGVPYVDDEDERLIAVIEALMEKGIEEQLLEQWLEKIFAQLEEVHQTEHYSLEFYRTKTNVLNFTKTLYFTLLLNNLGENVRGLIEGYMMKWYKEAKFESL